MQPPFKRFQIIPPTTQRNTAGRQGGVGQCGFTKSRHQPDSWHAFLPPQQRLGAINPFSFKRKHLTHADATYHSCRGPGAPVLGRTRGSIIKDSCFLLTPTTRRPFPRCQLRHSKRIFRRLSRCSADISEHLHFKKKGRIERGDFFLPGSPSPQTDARLSRLNNLTVTSRRRGEPIDPAPQIVGTINIPRTTASLLTTGALEIPPEGIQSAGVGLAASESFATIS